LAAELVQAFPEVSKRPVGILPSTVRLKVELKTFPNNNHVAFLQTLYFKKEINKLVMNKIIEPVEELTPK
jgi:hypothetical protein